MNSPAFDSLNSLVQHPPSSPPLMIYLQRCIEYYRLERFQDSLKELRFLHDHTDEYDIGRAFGLFMKAQVLGKLDRYDDALLAIHLLLETIPLSSRDEKWKWNKEWDEIGRWVTPPLKSPRLEAPENMVVFRDLERMFRKYVGDKERLERHHGDKLNDDATWVYRVSVQDVEVIDANVIISAALRSEMGLWRRRDLKRPVTLGLRFLEWNGTWTKSDVLTTACVQPNGKCVLETFLPETNVCYLMEALDSDLTILSVLLDISNNNNNNCDSKSVYRIFRVPGRSSQTLYLPLKENEDGEICGRIWDSAFELVRVLRDNPTSIVSLSCHPTVRILDLSSGTGFVGIYLAALFSELESAPTVEVVVSDLREAERLVERNIELYERYFANDRTHVKFIEHCWGDDASLKQLGQFDVVVATDLLYADTSDNVEMLRKTVESICRCGTVVYAANKQRGMSDEENAASWTKCYRGYSVVAEWSVNGCVVRKMTVV